MTVFTREPGTGGEGLAMYRGIAPGEPVGGLPVGTYLEIRQAYADTPLRPDEQLDYAWAGLEAAMAMERYPNPVTGKPFVPKERQSALKTAKSELALIAADESAPADVRAKAMLAQGGVDLYQESVRPSLPGKSGRHKVLLRSIKGAAQLLLEQQGEFSASDLELLNGMAGMVIYQEYASAAGWAMPAAPRQPWQITAVDGNRRGLWRGYAITDQDVLQGVVRVSPERLARDEMGGSLWGEGSEAGALALLRAYLPIEPGSLRPQKSSPFRRAAISFLGEVAAQTPETNEAGIPTAVGATALAETVSDEESFAFQVRWYEGQSAWDVRDIDQMVLERHIGELETGRITPAEMRTLGWMQFDRAQLHVHEAERLVAAAEEVRRQATNMPMADRPAYIQRASTMEEQANVQIAAARTRFDQAALSMTRATEGFRLSSLPGDTYRAQLEALAVPVYCDLVLNAPTINATVAEYYRQIARPLNKDRMQGQQAEIFASSVQLASLIALFAGRAEEGLRTLVLPASPRSSGSRGRLNAMVFPQIFEDEDYRYDYTPVGVQFVDGRSVDAAEGSRHVSIGRSLISPELFGNLARQIRDPSRTRRDDLVALSERLADSIAIASAE